MYRLVIVAGPNRGSSFALIEGENSIGRQMDNHIVLTSGKVSKRHCALLVKPGEVFLRDESSTNGTFVNGALTRRLKLKPGDKVSVGDFVMELIQSGASAQQGLQLAPMMGGGMPRTTSGNLAHAMPAHAHSAPQLSLVNQVEAPKDPADHAYFVFEGKLMPIFYGMLMKNEYKGIVGVLIALLAVVAVAGAAMPIQDLAERAIKNEAVLRARALAREVADRAAPAIAQHVESQIDLSVLENEESIKLVVITNTNLQIIAPQSRLNQLLAGGKEARFAMLQATLYKEGNDPGPDGKYYVDDHTAVYVEPIRTIDPRQVKNQVSAMAVVGIDFSRNMLESGGLGVAYGTGAVIAGLAALLIYLIILRLSSKPYEVLNDDLDQVLRGELPRVTQEFKMGRTDALWDNINAAVQRLPKGGGAGQFINENAVVNWDQEFAAIRALCDSSQMGFIAFDPNGMIVGLNTLFEEMSGIRIEVVGQNLQQAARDKAFVMLITSLKEIVQGAMTRSTLDTFEFNQIAYTVIGTSVGRLQESGLAVAFRKKE